MLLTNKRGEERNYGVLIAAIVAIVAIVGLIILFNKGGAQGAAVDKSDLAGMEESKGMSEDAGARCGKCSLDYSTSGVWDSATCPLGPNPATETLRFSGDHMAQECCKRECNNLNGMSRCMEWCRGAASEAWGYSRGTSNALGGE